MLGINGLKLIAAGLLLIIALGAGSVIAASKQQKETNEEDLGIRKESIYEEETVKPGHGEYPQAEAGKSKKIKRTFENSPPLISHDIAGMLPIAETNNMCLSCHMPEHAKSMGATPIPRSHLTNLETGEDLKGRLDRKRYDCMQCHVQQVNIQPPVKNLFKGEFRDEKGKERSNLYDILNEGVQAE